MLDELAGDVRPRRRSSAPSRRCAASGSPAARAEGHRRLELIADSQYDVEFPRLRAPSTSACSCPAAPPRATASRTCGWSRFTEADGAITYRGTYTAFDGESVAPHLLATDDFRTFHSRRLTGPAAQNKGMALFPRAVGGRYLALSRWDRESNSPGGVRPTCGTGRTPGTLQPPTQPWEIVQVGNCGSPLETRAGWLVLTHGVGPMRAVRDRRDAARPRRPPTRARQPPAPLLTPTADERDGYVPNVVYSCGAMLHGDTLVLPYGCSDSSIRVALVDVPQLLARILAG